MYKLHAQLIRFEDRFAVLRHESAGEFKWPIKNLPDNVQAGNAVTLVIDAPQGGVTSTATQGIAAPAAAGAVVEKNYDNMRRLLEELIN